MTLREVKEWIESLPVEFLDFSVVNAEEFDVTNYQVEPGSDVYYRYDKPVVSLNINTESQEILFMNEPVHNKMN